MEGRIRPRRRHDDVARRRGAVVTALAHALAHSLAHALAYALTHALARLLAQSLAYAHVVRATAAADDLAAHEVRRGDARETRGKNRR